MPESRQESTGAPEAPPPGRRGRRSLAPRFSWPERETSLWRRHLRRSLAALGVLLMHLWCGTWRVRFLILRPDGQIEPHRLSRIHRSLYCMHHGSLFMCAWIFRGYRFGNVIGLHGDAEWIAQMSGWLGFSVIRGSTTRRALRARMDLEELLGSGMPTAVTVDGPRGPRYAVQTGVVATAARAGTWMVPVAVASDWYWQLPSWDRFAIPLPFARVYALFGQPVAAPAAGDRSALESARRVIEQDLLAHLQRLHVAFSLPPSLAPRALSPGDPQRPPSGKRRITLIRGTR